jgi:putative endonuclease
MVDMYYTYVLRSEIDNKLYVGWTEDIERRLSEHNNGSVVSTNSRKPFKLIYYEACNKKEDAIAREKALKTGFGRAYIKRRVSE